MGDGARWKVNGRNANARDLAEALALGRAHRKRQAQADKEGRERDAQARGVALSILKAMRDQSRSRCAIMVRPASVSGSRKGRVRLRRFEKTVGLVHPARYPGGKGRVSSFHCKFTGRGAGNHRRAKDRPYTRGEAIRTIRYILREAAREIEGGGVVGNISTDPDIIAGLFAALEELEFTGGRANANVYMTLVVLLPHELDGEERTALLERVCAPLSEHHLPHVGVLHMPDPNGDQRNYHAHVVFSWRPFECQDDGTFGFAATTMSELNAVPFITAFRARAADAMNHAMAAAGHERRFTPQSRAARGDRPPTKAEGKQTAGEKHVERRREDIQAAQAERDEIGERQVSLERLTRVAEAIICRTPLDRAAVLDRLRQTETEIAARNRPPPPALPERAPPVAVASQHAPTVEQPRSESPPVPVEKPAPAPSVVAAEASKEVIRAAPPSAASPARDELQTQRSASSPTLGAPDAVSREKLGQPIVANPVSTGAETDPDIGAVGAEKTAPAPISAPAGSTDTAVQTDVDADRDGLKAAAPPPRKLINKELRENRHARITNSEAIRISRAAAQERAANKVGSPTRTDAGDLNTTPVGPGHDASPDAATVSVAASDNIRERRLPQGEPPKPPEADKPAIDSAKEPGTQQSAEPPAHHRDELMRRKKRKVAGPGPDVDGDQQVPMPTVLPKSDEASQDGAPPGTQVADEDEVDVVGTAWKDYLAGMGR